MSPHLRSLMKNGPLTFLSATVGITAFASVAPAGPSEDWLTDDVVVDCDHEQSATLPSTSELIESTFHRGFAPDLLSSSSHEVQFNEFSTPTNHVRPGQTLQDVSDFMPASWLLGDDALAITPEPIGERIEFAPPMSQVASPDVNVLSVPEIPLPPAIIPAFGGLLFVVYAHRRGLQRRKLLR